MSISMAEKYIAAFGNLAKESNTILLPSNVSDVGSMVAQVGVDDVLFQLQLGVLQS